MIVLADTHAYHWWLVEPERLSPAAGLALGAADEVVVSGITWYELAWLAANGRIATRGGIDAWLRRISAEVRTLGLTPAVAAIAATLPDTFSADPADRLIFATAMDHGVPLVSKDRSMREHARLAVDVVW